MASWVISWTAEKRVLSSRSASWGEDDALLLDLLGALGDVHGVVADALQIPDGVEVLGHRFCSAGGELLAGELDEVAAQLVLVLVDDVLPVEDELELLLLVVVDEVVGVLQVGPGLAGHVFHGLGGSAQWPGRGAG